MNDHQLSRSSSYGAGPQYEELRPWTPPGQDGMAMKVESGARRLWVALWPEKWFLIGCGAACAMVALVASLFQTPLYKAQTSLEIEDLNDRFLQLNEVDPVTKGGNSDAYLSTQVDVISSTALLSRVIKRLNLEEPYRKAIADGAAHPSFFGVWKKRLRFDSQPPTPREMALGDVKKNLDITAPRGASRVVTLQFISTDPRLAANFPNTLAQEFIDQGIELRMDSAHRLSGWLKAELDQTRQRLQASEEALQQYGQSAGLLFTDEKNSVAEAKLNQLQDELSKAQADRMQKQSTYELISKATPETLAQMLGNASLQEYQVKLTDLRRQLAEARALMTPSHYKVKQLAAQVTELESAVTGERKETANRVASDYAAAQRREALLAAAYDQQAKLVTAQDARASRYHVLQNEVDTNRQLYDAMLQRVKGVSLASAMRASNVAVFDPAEVPTRPYKPQPLLNTIVGLLSGFLLGGIYIFSRNNWDRSVRLPGQLGTYLNIPELGAVPTAAKKLSLPSPETRTLGKGMTRETREERGIEYALSHGHLSNGDLRSECAAQVADSFRAILASILLSTRKGRSPNVIVLTSPLAQEGKTTSATNLAVALAAIGKNVLLIDSDLRKPRLHQIFGLRNDRGFTDLLAEQALPEKAPLGKYIQPTNVPGLSVLTSGRNRNAGSNLLYGPWLPELFDRLRVNFDTILIDTPPVLLVADARVLGRNADGVVVVCRARSTDRERAKVAVERLFADGAHVIGTILNDFDPRTSSYYGQYYGKQYAALPEDGDIPSMN